MSEQTYSGKDLDAIFGPGAAAHAAQLSAGKTAQLPQSVSTRKAYYHLYTSENGRFQRGLHLYSETPRTGVKMPGFPKVQLAIATYSHHPSNTFKVRADGSIDTRDGKEVFLVTHYGREYEVTEGDPVIYEAPGHEEGAALDEALLAKENA